MIQKRMILQNRHNQIAILGLVLGVLLSLACITMTFSTEVMRTNDGKSLVSMQIKWEIDRDVWRAMQDYEPSQTSSPTTLPGWKTTQSDGGRIVDFIMDSTQVDGLPSKSWTVTEQKVGNGRIVTAKFKPESGSDPRSQALQYSITIDDRDSNLIRYSFDASMQVAKENVGNPFDSPDPKDSAKYAKWQKLDSAIKAAGAGKMIFVTTLPGTIEKTNGSAKGNQISWTIIMDKPGTYSLQASSLVKPGSSSALPPVVLNPVPTSAAGGSRGDCDGDGRITESDALCALEMSTRLRSVQLSMDVDNSGDVTSRDAVVILQRAIGK